MDTQTAYCLVTLQHGTAHCSIVVQLQQRLAQDLNMQQFGESHLILSGVSIREECHLRKLHATRESL